jgi:hypothetical protein
MRASSWRRFSIGSTVTCFLLAGTTGCQTGGPGMNWLSWGQKPSTTAISSAARPSASALPGPSATTNANGLASSSANPYGQVGYQAGQTAPGGYQTGPYATGSGSRSYPSASSSVAGVPTSGYGTQSASPPYQSPYQSGQSANTGSYSGYSTADSRSDTGYSSPTSTGGGATAAGSLNSEQWRRGGDASATQPTAGASYGGNASSYGGATPAASPYGGSTTPASSYPSANYGASASGGGYPQATTDATSGYQQQPSYAQPTESAPPSASRAWASDLEDAGPTSSSSEYPSATSYPSSSGSSAGLSESTTPGGWRPGSTARNPNALSSPSASATTPAAGSYPSSGSAYPHQAAPRGVVVARIRLPASKQPYARVRLTGRVIALFLFLDASPDAQRMSRAVC